MTNPSGIARQTVFQVWPSSESRTSIASGIRSWNCLFRSREKTTLATFDAAGNSICAHSTFPVAAIQL